MLLCLAGDFYRNGQEGGKRLDARARSEQSAGLQTGMVLVS